MTPRTAAHQHAHALLRSAAEKLDRLRSIEPYLIDLSLRENVFGARVGQTLADKLAILPKLRAFGFTNILLGTLDYFMPEEPEVDDDFMQHLRDHGIDMTGGFAFTDLGLVQPDGSFAPSVSMQKLADYTVPNTLHEIYLSRDGMQGQYDFETLMRSLPASIDWLHDHVVGDHGGAPRIVINIVDGCDAFTEDLDRVCDVLTLLATLRIEGVSFEDDRGTFLPFQIGTFTAIARSLLPPPLKLLVHIHAGAGFENASVMEALMHGADGAWGGLPKRAAMIGHASVGELIANLVRVGNPHMDAYRVDELLPLATSLQGLDDLDAVPEDLPILGRNAYRLTSHYFRQEPGRFMDLAPEAIGGRYRYRICPLASDQPILAARLAEVTGRPPESFPDAVLTRMVVLMRRDLRDGRRLVYDDPSVLVMLLERAAHDCAKVKPVHAAVA